MLSASKSCLLFASASHDCYAKTVCCWWCWSRYLLLCVCVLQELVAIMASSKGLVLMAPPSGNAEAQKTMAGMLSAIKPNTKVCVCVCADRCVVVCVPASSVSAHAHKQHGRFGGAPRRSRLRVPAHTHMQCGGLVEMSSHLLQVFVV